MSTQKKPATTFYASSTHETTELAWKLKRLNETHEMHQRKLREEFYQKSKAITDKLQAEQTAMFEELRQAMNIPDEDWGDGGAWALNIENLLDGTVALVHNQDLTRAACQCPICILRRAIVDQLVGDSSDESPVLH